MDCLGIGKTNHEKMEFYYTSHVSPVKRKVLGDINNTADSPISPTANLKLLTKVASQCDSIENVISTPCHRKELINLDTNPQMKGNLRKFKSLGFLCDKFLKLFPLEVPEHRDGLILLSDLARLLGVEKRRIYDIINVVESLQMATKIGKNSYSWSGRRKLADILSQLKAYAEQLGLAQYVRREQLKRKLYLSVKQEEVESSDSGTFIQNSNIASFFRNERRIGILCQKFVMLFLVSLEDGLINLELAADVLVADDCQQNKTRLRRLYDIANILVSLGIITKLDMGGGWKKPVFKYVGPPLHRMDHINYESVILSNLVKTELSDGVCSDMSEDSSEVSEERANVMAATESDHSYSLDISAAITPQPPAKKRLVFNTDTSNKVIFSSNKPVVIERTTPVAVTAPSTRLMRLIGPAGVANTITSGGLYKALKIGNSLHFIKVDNS